MASCGGSAARTATRSTFETVVAPWAIVEEGEEVEGSLETTRRLPRQPRNPLLEQGQESCALITYAQYQLCAPQRVHSKAKKKVRIKAGRNALPSAKAVRSHLGEGRAGQVPQGCAEDCRGPLSGRRSGRRPKLGK